MITYVQKNSTTINVKLEGKIVGEIKNRKGNPLYCYVPKGKSWTSGELFEGYPSLEACKKAIESEDVPDKKVIEVEEKPDTNKTEMKFSHKDIEFRYPVCKHVGILKENAVTIVDELNAVYPNRDIMICGIGTSGAMIMTVVILESIAKGRKFHSILLAKHGESDHRNVISMSEPILHLKKPLIVIVDDIIASGSTMRNIGEILTKHNYVDFVEGICAGSAITRRGKMEEIFPKLNFLMG